MNPTTGVEGVLDVNPSVNKDPSIDWTKRGLQSYGSDSFHLDLRLVPRSPRLILLS